jgi:hypothetical protein
VCYAALQKGTLEHKGCSALRCMLLTGRTARLQKALSVELAIELERETFGQYVQRISIVSVLVVCFFV